MRTVVLAIGTLVAALGATIPLSAKEVDWQAICCYCLAGQSNDSLLPRCKPMTVYYCQVLLPNPDSCESTPVPNVPPPRPRGGVGPGGGPCCPTCYCY